MNEDNGLDAEFQSAIHRIDDLVKEFEEDASPEVRGKVFELLQAVDLLHRVGLNQLIASFHEHGQPDWFDCAVSDPVIRTLFVLYDLVPPDPQVQAEVILENIRPYIQSHGGDVVVLGVENGVVDLQISGACLECPDSRLTLKNGIQEILRQKLPGFAGIVVHASKPVTPVPG